MAKTNTKDHSRIRTYLNRPGIYQLRNTLNGKLYIGSSNNLRKRKNRHFDQLRSNEHHSIYLQRSFNKHGQNCIVFEVIEFIDDVLLLVEKEQFYLDKLKPKYNMCKRADRTVGFKHTAKTIARMKKAHTGHKHSVKTKQKIGKSNTGKIMSIESKLKMVAAWVKRRKTA